MELEYFRTRNTALIRRSIRLFGERGRLFMKLVRKMGRLPAVAAMALLGGLEKREREKILQQRLSRRRKEI